MTSRTSRTSKPPKRTTSTAPKKPTTAPPMDVSEEWLERTSMAPVPAKASRTEIEAPTSSRRALPPPLPQDLAGSPAPASRSKSKRPSRGPKARASAEARLRELGLTLPPAPEAMGVYATCVQSGNTLYLAGHGPLRPDGTWLTGRLGDDLDVAAGREAARLTALAMLATLRDRLGSLDRVERFLKVLAFVRCTPDFAEQPRVANGFSFLMEQVFGEAAIAARSAVGAHALPAGTAIEIEAIVEIAPD
jgi:enamine deaminase RidA (YjgF/YER057c/UK114 family)